MLDGDVIGLGVAAAGLVQAGSGPAGGVTGDYGGPTSTGAVTTAGGTGGIGTSILSNGISTGMGGLAGYGARLAGYGGPASFVIGGVFSIVVGVELDYIAAHPTGFDMLDEAPAPSPGK